ncbi:hypothetical protein [Erwinia typographi]|nr:hypothetical protein [Erwinia typographi]
MKQFSLREADISKSRKAGFTGYQYIRDGFNALFARLKAERLIAF